MKGREGDSGGKREKIRIFNKRSPKQNFVNKHLHKKRYSQAKNN